MKRSWTHTLAICASIILAGALIGNAETPTTRPDVLRVRRLVADEIEVNESLTVHGMINPVSVGSIPTSVTALSFQDITTTTQPSK